MAGVLLASRDGAGWTVETVDLWLTGRHRGDRRLSTDQLGDGPQPLLCRFGRMVAFCANEDGLSGLGVDLSQMAAAAPW
jgi:hypothetical protein